MRWCWGHLCKHWLYNALAKINVALAGVVATVVAVVTTSDAVQGSVPVATVAVGVVEHRR